MSSVPVLDPYTGEVLNPCGTCSRIVRESGKTYFIWIYVYLDSRKKYHRALPDFLLPYKHYTVQTIESALDGDSDLDQYDGPSDSSIWRWDTKVSDLLSLILLELMFSSIFRQLVQSSGLSADDPEALLDAFQNTYKRDVHNKPDYLSASGWLVQLLRFSIFIDDFEWFKLCFLRMMPS